MKSKVYFRQPSTLKNFNVLTFSDSLYKLLSNKKNYISVTSHLVSMIFGFCFSWFLKDILGSQISMFLLSPIWIVGWFILSLSKDYISIMCGCVLVGLASGFNMNVAMEYLVEIPEPRLRGVIAVFSTACCLFGVLLGHLSGIAVETQPLGMQLCAVVPVLSMVFIYWSPPSPYWLLKKNQVDKARSNFYYLRGQTPESVEEFDEILSRQSDIETETWRSSMKKLTRGFMRPFFISVLIFSTTCGSGSDVMIMYAKRVLTQLSSRIDPNLSTILMDVICIVFCTLSSYVIKKVTRRSLFFISCLGEILSLLAIIAAQIYNFSAEILTVILCVYMAINSLGLNPIAWLVPAEIFPESNRPVGIGASLIYNYLITIALSLFIPTDDNNEVNANMVPVLWIFVGMMSVCSFFLFFVMPETKDISLEEVENQMKLLVKFIEQEFRIKIFKLKACDPSCGIAYSQAAVLP
ncbi:hypothetical protein V9T40_011522 [Parthenolecanium corni]|uniref:Major facilitator superfamily (MFS) profile domain-containing protein n=1 Tax=Parthenolecanium corni TaxID=536013 RepID=A0AAN9XY88_9HEMI